MLATARLTQQLEHYQQLGFHHNACLAMQLLAVQEGQRQRLQQQHHHFFEQPHYQPIICFLMEYFYCQQHIVELAQQLDKALQEKIKLDRFLSKNILEAALLSFELAYLTLKLDEAIAQYLLDQQLLPTPDHIQHAIIQLNQQYPRQQQLDLLASVSAALHQYSHNFLIQSAFKLAKSTAYRREFHFLYDYLAQAFKAIRATPHCQHFFNHLIAEERKLIASACI